MNRYEALVLAVPGITQDEITQMSAELDRVVKKGNGSVISFERWGKYRLSYPVNKNEYGVYFLARFESEDVAPLLKDVETLLAVKLNDIVMRSMISALDVNQPLTYQRPQSLEEAPAKEESFMRDREGRGGYGYNRGHRGGSNEESMDLDDEMGEG